MSSGTFAGKIVQKENHVLSVDDLEQALELTDKEEIKNEQSMLQGIIRFGDETAKEIMTPRQDIVDLNIKDDFNTVLNCVVENNYSRIPVYQGNVDNIRGVLYIKDLLPHIGKTASFRWQTLIRPPYFVPETKKIDDLLREFQENKIHIAIVVDEFGGTSGLVTLEDILEEIVGEIHDEYDEEEKTTPSSTITRISLRERRSLVRFLQDSRHVDPMNSMMSWVMPTLWPVCSLKSRATSSVCMSESIIRITPSR